MNPASYLEIFKIWQHSLPTAGQQIGFIYTPVQETKTIFLPPGTSITFFLLTKTAKINTYTYSEGHFTSLNTDSIHQNIEIITSDNCRIFWLIHTKDIQPHILSKEASRSSIQLYYWICKLLLQMSDKKANAWEIKNNCNLLQSMILQHKPGNQPKCDKFYHVFSVIYSIAALNDVSMSTWNVATFTSSPHVSQHEFQRIFKAIFRMSVNEWLISQKMYLAANLLLHSQESIASIGTAIGFSSESNFTTSFNRHYHTTPALFRKAAHVLNM